MKISYKINWIFFDVGGVLIDDTEYEKQRMDLLLQAIKRFRPEITTEKIFNARHKASSMLGSLTRNIIELLLKDRKQIENCIDFIKNNWSEEAVDQKIRPEAKEIIKKLSQKYNLGLLLTARQSW